MFQPNIPYQDYLFSFTEMTADLFGRDLTGVYLHGSAAMGCFHPQKSDLDLILVAEGDLSDTSKMEFMKRVVEFHGKAPAKGLELSIVKRKYCRPFVYPTPFELHFSRAHLEWFKRQPEEYIRKMKGTDPDLAAHFTVLQTYGIVLYGEEISHVFDAVPRECYLDSIWRDIQNAREDILEDPLYMTLNLCRVLAFLREDLILSKQSGGEWGLLHLPKTFHSLIQDALHCYGSGDKMKSNADILSPFADYMLTEIASVLPMTAKMQS